MDFVKILKKRLVHSWQKKQLLTHLPEKLLFQKLYKEPKLWSKKDSYILIQCPKNGRSGHCLKTIEQTT